MVAWVDQRAYQRAVIIILRLQSSADDSDAGANNTKTQVEETGEHSHLHQQDKTCFKTKIFQVQIFKGTKVKNTFIGNSK